jgi:hypothetical protein
MTHVHSSILSLLLSIPYQFYSAVDFILSITLVFRMQRDYSRSDYKDGTFAERETYLDSDGKIHRDDDKPANRKRERDGTEILQWQVHGKLHRPNRPAFIKRSPSGELLMEMYWENDRIVSSPFLKSCLSHG